MTMTTPQIFALIGLILGAVLIYWTGYRGGLIDGRAEEIDEGKNTQQANNSEEIRTLTLLLEQSRGQHKSLYRHYTRALEAAKLGATDRQHLLAIAEKLKLAADIFRAFNAPNQATQALALREKASDMAATLEPIAQEKAA